MSSFHSFFALDKAAFLFTALLIYAFLGSPTPDNPGVIEIIIAFFLILAMGAGGLKEALIFKNGHVQDWAVLAQILLFYGMSVPLLVGLALGHGAGPAIRDMIPFLFLLLPLFFMQSARSNPRFANALLYGFLIIGVLFSIRSLHNLLNFDLGRILFQFESGELLYLANMPSVLFAGIFFLFLAGSALSQKNHYSYLRAFMFMIFALLPVIAMALTIQRASMVAIGISFLIGLTLILKFRPVLGFVILFLTGIACAAYSDILIALFKVFAEKTKIYGSNMRFDEFEAVWEAVSVSPLSLIFGLGWGASFASPAVAEITVQFTHNFFSSVLLKMGLFGVFLSFLYMTAMLSHVYKNIRENYILWWAVFWPLLIDLFLYASFKSLDFGLLLCLIAFAHLYGHSRKQKSEPHEAKDTLHKPGLSPA